MLATYLASDYGRRIAPAIASKLLWVLERTQIGALTDELAQVDVLRRMLERLAALSPTTETRPLLKVRQTISQASKRRRAKAR